MMPSHDALDELIHFFFTAPVEEMSAENVAKRCGGVDAILSIIGAAATLLLSEPNNLDLSPPVAVFGSFNTDIRDLRKGLSLVGFLKDMEKREQNESKVLLLGNFSARGPHSLGTTVAVLCLKLRYPEHFFILKGTSEILPVCRSQYRGNVHDDLQNTSVDMMRGESTPTTKADVRTALQHMQNSIPFTAVIGERIYCSSGGGMSPYAKIPEDHFEMLSKIERPIAVENRVGGTDNFLVDVLFSEFEAEDESWSDGSGRHESFVFGFPVVDQFLEAHNFDCMVSGHMVIENGFETHMPREKYVQLFSASDFLGEFDNQAGLMFVDVDMKRRYTAFNRRKD